MEKYPNAVVYRLKCYTTNTYYIGSTVNLSKRMKTHRIEKNGTTSKSIIAGGNYGEPKKLLDYPCNDKKELRELEQGFIDTYRKKYGDAVLNLQNAYTTEEERKEKKRENSAKHRAENPDKVKESSAKHRANNREKIRAKANEKIECVCGGSYTRTNKAHHFDTKTHQKFIQNQNQNQTQTHLS